MGEKTIALAGNPNVGKSTLFNALTGLRQHTGNWAGKTVGAAWGRWEREGESYRVVDLPGCLSLLSQSGEERAARDFLCENQADAVLAVCDATALERCLPLALQVLELTPRAVVCINLLDEARKKGIRVDLQRLEKALGAPVVGVAARGGQGLGELEEALAQAAAGKLPPPPSPPPVGYGPEVERAVARLEPLLAREASPLPARWRALRLLEGALQPGSPAVGAVLEEAWTACTRDRFGLLIAQGTARRGEELARLCVQGLERGYSPRDQALDRLFTGRWTAFPLMGALLAGLLWLTMWGANVPSQWLSALFAALGQGLEQVFRPGPEWLSSLAVEGVFGTLGWVVAVMLPPMALFFPLFALLEDFGFLPRAAYNLDRAFQWSGACGKQALTACMGLGCNAAGVVGCRIIDSPRERLIALATNSFTPCNGRLPLLAALTGLFFSGWAALAGAAALAALSLGGTLLASWLLSRTLLRGTPSFFALELPPYRRPQVGRVLWRSLWDRTLGVLGRAAAVAAPAGAVIWCLGNVTLGGRSLLSHWAAALDPLGRFLGMDGPILLAFLLALPANELVLPLLLMIYSAQGQLAPVGEGAVLLEALASQGWTWVTALCAMVFSMFHWPCSTTCWTLYRETRSLRWTLLSLALPTAFGAGLCALIAGAARALGLI